MKEVPLVSSRGEFPANPERWCTRMRIPVHNGDAGGRPVRNALLTILVAFLFLALLTRWAPAQEENVTWLVTEWGSVYRNLHKVADRKFENARQIAGTADHYYVYTRDGSIWKDGTRLVSGFYKDMNVVDMDARGDDYYVLTLQGNLYRNGQVIMPAGTIERPSQLIVRGADIFILNDSGEVYRNGSLIGERFYLDGFYPTHFATDGTDYWFSVFSQSSAGGSYRIYKNRERAHDETWVVRDLACIDGRLEIFSGRSLFRDWQRVARFEPDKAQTTSHVDNTADFFFVLP